VVGANSTTSPSVLLVDDDRSIVDWQMEFLKGCGLHSILATSADDAMAICRSGKHQLHCIVTDMSMPGKSGEWLAKQCLAEFPAIPIVLSTGYHDIVLALPNVHSVLIKPFGPSLLLKAIRDALSSAPNQQPPASASASA
jgi:DNA-binding NtrC family response regulator